LSDESIAAVFSTIYQNKLLKYLPLEVVPAAVSAGYPDDPISLQSLLAGITTGSGVPGLTPRVVQAIADPVKTAYSRKMRWREGLSRGSTPTTALKKDRNNSLRQQSHLPKWLKLKAHGSVNRSSDR